MPCCHFIENLYAALIDTVYSLKRNSISRYSYKAREPLVTSIQNYTVVVKIQPLA